MTVTPAGATHQQTDAPGRQRGSQRAGAPPPMTVTPAGATHQQTDAPGRQRGLRWVDGFVQVTVWAPPHWAMHGWAITAVAAAPRPYE
ncbi:MAG: hypothetical protein KatS3mg051_2225 [Anaerolineae bacterium]|nr:MAG: hypothetical protein KatS3mg051_2225 [Anaerolineae bacterium]